ncbi:MAG: aldo/keto reductase [Micromonosporaceae bacterium]|nr:aldo/keto reductase [Micromonosporaceae bacterium]
MAGVADPASATPAAGNGTATRATTLSSRRSLGRLTVSSIGLGCQTMTGTLYGPVSSREDMIKIIRTAVDQGVTLFDTAEAYGPFESERIVGEALRPVRERVTIASKFGWNIDPDTGQQGVPRRRCAANSARVRDELSASRHVDRRQCWSQPVNPGWKVMRSAGVPRTLKEVYVGRAS